MSPLAATELPMEQRYRLVELQKEELKVQTKIDDFPQWGAPALDQAGYQQKELLQRSTAHSKRGSIFWALVERTPAHANGTFGDDSDVGDADIVAGETPILCHCESHPFDAVLRNPNGELTRGRSYNIGSVFTLPSARGKGLASFFLTAIQKRLPKVPNAIGSALYSDIGPTFYDKLGWRLYKSTEAEIKLASPLNAAVQDAANEPSLTKLFLDQDLDDLLQRDNKRLVGEITSSKYDGQEVFASLPSRESVEWQFCLGVLYANLRGFPSPPSQTGVHIDDDAFLVWCHNLKESTLYIVHARLPADRPTAVVTLLRAAIVEARKFGLKIVVMWDPVDAVLSPAVTSEVEVVKQDREDSLSSLIVFDQHRTQVGAVGVLPVWLNNEKHAWV